MPKRWYRKPAVEIILALVISIAIMYFLFSNVSFKQTWDAFTHIRPGWLLLGFALYIVTTFLKGIRWRQVLRNKISLRESFNIMNVNLMLNNLLPFKTGELSMLFLLRKKGIKYRVSFAYLVVLRLFDLFALLLIFFAGFLAIKASLALPGIVFILIIAFFAVTTLLLAGIIYWHKESVRLAGRFLKKARLSRKGLARAFLKKAGQVSIELGHLKGLSLPLVLISIVTWFLGVVSVQVLLQGMGVSFPLEKMLLAITLQVILSNLPVQGLAGFGTYEGFWAVSFVLLGMDRTTAIITGISTHIILLAMSILLGLVGLAFALPLKKRFS